MGKKDGGRRRDDQPEQVKEANSLDKILWRCERRKYDEKRDIKNEVEGDPGRRLKIGLSDLFVNRLTCSNSGRIRTILRSFIS